MAMCEHEWQPIETAPNNQKVIVGYLNPLGNWRTVMGCYYAERTLEADNDCIDRDEDGFAPEGWYEETEVYDHLWMTDHYPTHWMPLPAPPTVGKQEDEG